jgi:hypothetical protein
MHGLTPWLVWLGGVPAAAVVFRVLALATGEARWVALGLAGVTVLLTWFVRHMSHQRSSTGRGHHSLNMLCALGLVSAVAYAGPTKTLLITYAILGLAGSLAWNIRYSVHTDGADEVMAVGKAHRGKMIDFAYVVRVLSGRAPVIRAAAEKSARIVPALAAPWREPPKIAPASEQAAIAGADPQAVTPKDAALALKRAQEIKKNFTELTTHKIPDLAGSRLVIKAADVRPWRIHGEIRGIRGVHTPKSFMAIREELASQCAMPLASVVMIPNPKRHDWVFADFVLENVLKNAITWPGPLAPGQSIAAAPCRVGVYEDRTVATRFGPAITPEMARALRRPAKNLSHLLMEGQNGSGKSTFQRTQVADASTRVDIEEWLIDTVKRAQTFGRMGLAFRWFATTKPEAVAQVKFLADRVIPARADYLGVRGYDNWEPGCGLPYLRVTVEEGGVIFDELEKLVDVLMIARSTGVELDGSIQRAHHGLMDTNVRAQFSEAASFGCQKPEDAFVLPDELSDAGADPSQWKNKQPGMCYWASSELELEQQLMPMRGFDVDMDTAEQLISEHVPARERWIAENCPDWDAMLATLDKNGVWAKRTTGAAVYQTVSKQKRGAKPAEDGTDWTAEVIRVAEPVHTMNPGAISAPDDESYEDEMEPVVTLDELELDPETQAEVAADMDEINPHDPIPPVDPADDVRFGRPESGMTREQSLKVLRSFLAQQGAGFEFSCSDIYNDDDLCERIGRSAGWIRTQVSTVLVAEGLLSHDAAEGKYRVEPPRLTLAPPPERAAG